MNVELLTTALVWAFLSVSAIAQPGGFTPKKAPIMVELEKRLDAMPELKAPFHGGIVYKTIPQEDIKLDLYLPFSDAADAESRHPICVHVHGCSLTDVL